MVFDVHNLLAGFVITLVCGTLFADEPGLEEQFKSPPPNATRPSVVLKLDRAQLGSEWASRQLERIRDIGAGGVLVEVPVADATSWGALAVTVNRARQLGLDVGLDDFFLSADEAASLPRARRLVWTSCPAVPAEELNATNTTPQVFLPVASYREIARLAVPDDVLEIQPYQVLDLTTGPTPTGGVWRICRFGVVDEEPLRVDPLDGKALIRHVNQWLFASQSGLVQTYGNTVLWYQLSGVSSSELAWTSDLPDVFLKQNGIGLMRHFPAFAGVAVGGEATAAYVRRQAAQTVRELWRERFGKTVNERVHEAGLEAGIRIDQVPVAPVEVALYFRRPTLVIAPGVAHAEANVLAAGGARTMGRRYVMGLLSPLDASPIPDAMLHPFPWKHEADRLLADGATRLLLDTGGCLPSEDMAFRQLREGCTYIHRCQVMLQQGSPVSDFLVWAERLPSALASYSCDYVNGPMLETAAVRNGIIQFDSGRTYGKLAVSAEVLSDPAAERTVRQMAVRGVNVWLIAEGGAEESVVFARLQAAEKNVAVLVPGAASALLPETLPDFEWRSEAAGMNVRFLHRRTSRQEVYFLVNDSAEAGPMCGTFRDVGQGIPFRWDPVDGEVGVLGPEVRRGVDGRVTATLFLAPHDACFVVFER